MQQKLSSLELGRPTVKTQLESPAGGAPVVVELEDETVEDNGPLPDDDVMADDGPNAAEPEPECWLPPPGEEEDDNDDGNLPPADGGRPAETVLPAESSGAAAPPRPVPPSPSAAAPVPAAAPSAVSTGTWLDTPPPPRPPPPPPPEPRPPSPVVTVTVPPDDVATVTLPDARPPPSETATATTMGHATAGGGGGAQQTGPPPPPSPPPPPPDFEERQTLLRQLDLLRLKFKQSVIPPDIETQTTPAVRSVVERNLLSLKRCRNPGSGRRCRDTTLPGGISPCTSWASPPFWWCSSSCWLG